MILIEPVSSLSIKRAVNLYTIILFLSFGILLYWLATERHQIYIDYHTDTANNTTKIVAFQVSKTLKEKQRITDIFVETHRDIITEMANNPDDEKLQHEIETLLKKYQPDFFAFNIMTIMGEPIIGDFDNDIGELCLDDLNHFIQSGKQRIRIHPNNNVYHFDILSEFSSNNGKHLFFVSFNVDELTNLLSSTQPEKHNLILIDRGSDNLIEVTAQGSRNDIKGRLDFRMSGEENLRVISSQKVKSTNWHIVDMRDEGLFHQYKKKILKEYIIAFYAFTIIALFMRNILLNQDEKRTAAEELLQKNHKQIKDLNHQLEMLSRTDSLTGLYNRRYFDEMINKEWNRCLRSHKTLSCILIDVDHFKDYNDAYGHQAGDKCLKDISILMKETFRRASDTVARYGGEEFIIVMSGIDDKAAEKAIKIFQKELERLRIFHKTSEVCDHVTISAGIVSQVPSKASSIEEFINKADKALYTAKAEGRNRYVTYKE